MAHTLLLQTVDPPGPGMLTRFGLNRTLPPPVVRSRTFGGTAGYLAGQYRSKMKQPPSYGVPCVLEKKGAVLGQESLPFLAALLSFAVSPRAR